MNGKPILWHLAVSHYSEKVRWALDYKRVPHARRTPPPGGHMGVALWLTRGQHFTLPVLTIDGQSIGDSTAIIAALEERYPEPALYPSEPEQRSRALELEEYFDEELGPQMRLIAFHLLHQEPDRFDEIAAQTAPGPMANLGRFAGVYGRAFTAVRYGVRDVDAAEVARRRVGEALDRLEAELGDDEYLVGDQFTVADLTAAALLYPLVLPAEGPLQAAELSAGAAELRESFSERPAFRWVEETFRRHRHQAATPIKVGGG